MGALRASLMLKTSARLIPRLTSLVPGIYSMLDRERFCAKTLAAMTRSGSGARRGHSHRPWALSGTTSQATRSCPPSDAALLIGFSGPPEEQGSAAILRVLMSLRSCCGSVRRSATLVEAGLLVLSVIFDRHQPLASDRPSGSAKPIACDATAGSDLDMAAESRTILPTACPARRPRTALGKSAGRGLLLAPGGGEYCQHQGTGQGERRRVAGAGGEQAEDGWARAVSGVVGKVPQCAGLGFGQLLDQQRERRVLDHPQPGAEQHHAGEHQHRRCQPDH